MPVFLDHAIVLAKNKGESAAFFTRLFGLPGAVSWGPFLVVEPDNDGGVLFAEPGVDIQPQHLAFLVSEEDSDGIYAQMVAGGVGRWPDPQKSLSDTNNANRGDRGMYLYDPAGHNPEILTRPICCVGIGARVPKPAAPLF